MDIMTYRDMEDKRCQFSLSLLGSTSFDHVLFFWCAFSCFRSWQWLWYFVSLFGCLIGLDLYLHIIISCYGIFKWQFVLFFRLLLFSWSCCPEKLWVEVLGSCWPANLGCCLATSLLPFLLVLPHPHTPIHTDFNVSIRNHYVRRISCYLLFSHRWRMRKNIWRNEHLSVIFNADTEHPDIVSHSASNRV